MGRFRKHFPLMALVLLLGVALLLTVAACKQSPIDPESVARGGAMYDKWWKVAEGASEPTADQPLWATQSLNTRSGSTTWRCKECHGWDYKGKDGAYASGSHKTGFTGVFDAGGKSPAELVKVLKGGDNADHDFSSVLSDEALKDLANFVSEGLIDEKPHINYSTKKVIGANLGNGKSLYDEACASCHGSDGLMIDFGDGDGVATLANGNPWETLHKIRFGHPGTAMPVTYLLDWSVQDQVDVLGYSQTLPEVDPASVARGGLMYDKWWKVAAGASEPTADQPLWATQTSNTRSGSTTWRCKECHGWDYMGKDGAYAGGSHFTGFTGVFGAGSAKSPAQLLEVMQGGNNADHDFSGVMGGSALQDVANFLSAGLVDNREYIDYDTKKAIGANLGNGKSLYDGNCAACHGADGRTIDFGDGDGVGELANGNPWETLHKIRFGQPGVAGMPSAHSRGWSTQDAVDLLGYAQSLTAE